MNSCPIEEEHYNIVANYLVLCKIKQCLWCKLQFKEGIIIPMPRDIITPFSARFKGEFLFHVQDTHGLPIPWVLDWFEEFVRSANE